MKNLGHFLSPFARGRESVPIHEIKPSDVESWVLLGDTPWSRSTRLSRLSTLFSFAERRGWINSNPCKSLESISIESLPPRILTVPQCSALLSACGPDIRPWVSLCLFAGLRPAEAERLDWSAIRLPDAKLIVDAAASKVRRRRIVPLLPAALRWLSLDVKTSGPVVSSHSTLRRRRRAAAKAAGVDWSQDVLRHSFASYALGAGHSVNEVADWMGNSPRILLTHYRELVTAEESARFWALR